MSADIVYCPDLVKRAETLNAEELGEPRNVTGVNIDGPLIFTSVTMLPSLESEKGLTIQAFPWASETVKSILKEEPATAATRSVKNEDREALNPLD
jgi:hypothetical protein